MAGSRAAGRPRQRHARRARARQHRRRPRATTSRRPRATATATTGCRSSRRPRSPEAIELMADAFEIAERYRTPVMILADGVLGQAMEPVEPHFRERPARPGRTGSSTGAEGRPPRVVKLAPPPTRGPGARTTATSRRSSPRSPPARSAGRASTRRRRVVRGGLRHRGAGCPHGGRAGQGRRAARRALPADHPVAVPVGRAAPTRRGGARARAGRSSCRPARWSRTCGSRSRVASRCSSTAARAAWCRRPDEVVRRDAPRLGGTLGVAPGGTTAETGPPIAREVSDDRAQRATGPLAEVDADT